MDSKGVLEMSLFKSGDFRQKKKTVYAKKTQIPTQVKSKKVYCRNCNCQNTESAKTCIQCEITIKEPKMRRKMK